MISPGDLADDLRRKLRRAARMRSPTTEENAPDGADTRPDVRVSDSDDAPEHPNTVEEPSAGPERLHPSLEVRPDLVLFGFQEDRITESAEEEIRNVRLLSLVVSEQGVEVQEIEDHLFSAKGQRYLIPDRYDHPPRLDQEWERQDLTNFLEDPDAPAGQEVYRKLREGVHRHVDLEDEGAEILVSLYPAISFVFPVFPAVPFLLFLGPKETGKSQALDVLSRLCRCGHKSRATAASIGDLVESQRATLLLDQADNLGGQRGDLLTDSYRAGTRRTVADEERRGQPHSFRIYSPKVFAAHDDFDEDLLDRCIQIPMSPAARHVEPLLAGDERLDVLRHQLYRYAALTFPELHRTHALDDPDTLADRVGLANRPWELFRPFACVFEWLDVPDGDREAALEFFKQSLPNTSAQLPTEKAAVLRAAARLDDESTERLRLRSPQVHKKAESELGSGEQISRAQVGRILKDFNLVQDRSRPRVNGDRVTEWVIDRTRLQRTIERWGLDAEPDGSDTDGQYPTSAPCPPIEA